jgi:hypothetical protein
LARDGGVVTTDWTSKLRGAPLGTIALLAVVGVLYCALLSASATPLASGEDAFSQAWGSLLLTFWLWVALAALLLVGGVKGHMPRWAALSALLLHPLSGVAAFAAEDAASRHIDGALIIVALLPLVVAGYALWARLPRLRARLPEFAASIGAGAAILLLSVAALMTSM